jgi:hypothetical protein
MVTCGRKREKSRGHARGRQRARNGELSEEKDDDVPCMSAMMRESSPAGELLCLSSPICCAGGGGTRISPEPP